MGVAKSCGAEDEMSEIEDLFQPHLRSLVPYSTARDEFGEEAAIKLDANENPNDWLGAIFSASEWSREVNRYPDPHSMRLRIKLAELKGLKPEQIFVGNGSDEAIDLITKLFVCPQREKIVIMPPTYGMYAVSAATNNVEVVRVSLTVPTTTESFQPDLERIAEVAKVPNVKMLFVCSPNNPTGNAFSPESIRQILEIFPGIVVIDEAYQDFSSKPSSIELLNAFPRLVVIQTLSKAWGLAGLRVGLAYAGEQIIGAMNRIKPPYNINILSQRLALIALQHNLQMKNVVSIILRERDFLETGLKQLPIVHTVYPSDTNFLLVRFQESSRIFKLLISKGIVVRDRSQEMHCKNCLRITVGTSLQNAQLLEVLSKA